MHVYRGFLVEEQRKPGIRGAPGIFDACLPDRVSRRNMTDADRAARDEVRGTDERPWHTGTAQQQAMGRALSAFVGRALAEPELPNGPAFLDPSPRRFKPGPGKASKREDRLIKAEAKRQQSDYQRTVAEARRGLDMSNPRHVARFERRMASRTASADNSLNTALKLARECGETTGLIGR